jgi:hypothetical protein
MRLAVFLALLITCPVHGQVSPFNGIAVPPPDSTGHYRLIFGGHFHGASSNQSGFPAATLLANLDTINALRAHALLSTGDLFLHPAKDLSRYQRALFDRLRVPLFNAPGNHDVEDGSYAMRFGPTHGGIDLGGDRVVLLDTERDNGNIRGEQLDLLKELGARVAGSRAFIVSHRPLWAEGDARYGKLFAGNTRSLLPTNYAREVQPLLEQAAALGPVYWIAGSMAGRAPSSIFFQRHAENLYYLQCALRDVPRDALLVADVYPDSIRWWGLSLTGVELRAPEDCDADWWRANLRTEPAFRWRMLPLHIRRVVTHHAFWWGVGVSLLVWLVGRVLRRH